MADKPDDARTEISESLKLVKKAFLAETTSVIVKIFLTAKADEIVEIFAESYGTEKQAVFNLLNEIGSETMTKLVEPKGSEKDEECECGACHAKFKDKQKFCPACGVEFA